MSAGKRPTKTQVIRLARDHPELGPILKDGGHVVLAEPDRGRGASDRLVLGVRDRSGSRNLVAVADRNGIRSVHDTPARFQLSDDERKVAEQIAASDARIKSFIRRRPLDPLTRLYFPPGRGDHRHAIVFARPTSTRRRYAVIDLAEERVIDVLDESDLTRQENP